MTSDDWPDVSRKKRNATGMAVFGGLMYLIGFAEGYRMALVATLLPTAPLYYYVIRGILE